MICRSSSPEFCLQTSFLHSDSPLHPDRHLHHLTPSGRTWSGTSRIGLVYLGCSVVHLLLSEQAPSLKRQALYLPHGRSELPALLCWSSWQPGPQQPCFFRLPLSTPAGTTAPVALSPSQPHSPLDDSGPRIQGTPWVSPSPLCSASGPIHPWAWKGPCGVHSFSTVAFILFCF